MNELRRWRRKENVCKTAGNNGGAGAISAAAFGGRMDRVGLQLGQGAQEIRRVLVALDVNEAVAAEAKKLRPT